MAINFTQGDFGAFVLVTLCDGRGDSAAELPSRFPASDGATAGTVAHSQALGASDTNVKTILFQIPVNAGVSWNAGTWTVRFNVTTANMNITVTEIYVCRQTTAGADFTIGSATGLSISCGATGVKSQAVTGAAQTPSVGDEVYVVIIASNGSMTAQSFSITPNQNIDSPFTEPDPDPRRKPVNVSQAVHRSYSW